MDNLYKLNLMNILKFEESNSDKSSSVDSMWFARTKHYYDTIYLAMISDNSLAKKINILSLDSLVEVARENNHKKLTTMVSQFVGVDLNLNKQKKVAYEQFGYTIIDSCELFSVSLNLSMYHIDPKYLEEVQRFIQNKVFLKDDYKDSIKNYYRTDFFPFSNGFYSLKTNKIWIFDGIFVFGFDIETLNRTNIFILGQQFNLSQRQSDILFPRISLFNRINHQDVFSFLNEENNILEDIDIDELTEDDITAVLEMKYSI